MQSRPGPAFSITGTRRAIRRAIMSSTQLLHELRDPAILVDEGKIYLFYSIAGEAGIAVAELKINS